MIVLPADVLEKCDEKTKRIISSVLDRIEARLIDAHQSTYQVKFDVKRDEEIQRKIKK